MDNQKFSQRDPLEINDNWKTGAICPETGQYICEMHPYIEKWVVKDDVFPKCDQKNLPHNTTWSKLG